MQAWTLSSTCGLAKITGRSFYIFLLFRFERAGVRMFWLRNFASLEILAQQCFALSLGMV